MNLLLIFTRNPEWGKCKTRLASTIGNDAALAVYKKLLAHTVAVTKDLSVTKQVYYSDAIAENDIWDNSIYEKRRQMGNDLGARIQHAFEQGLEEGYKNIVIIGSDLFDINSEEIEEAFLALQENDFVIGPAEDGGYYLLGMNTMKPELFQNKAWGTPTVLKSTLANLKDKKHLLLPLKNDIDYFEDIKDIPQFQTILKHYGITQKS